MYAKRRHLGRRLLGAVDLAIDFATLGEYGLESSPADRACRERAGHRAGREALARPAAGGDRPRRPRPGRCDRDAEQLLPSAAVGSRARV